MNNSRDVLRSATLGSKRVFAKEVIEFAGHQFEIRQPTIKQRSELRKKCTSISPNGVEFNMFDFLVWSVICNTYVPGTDELVFDDEDYDTLVENPTGGFMDNFSDVAARLINVDTAEVKKPSKKAKKTN